MKSTNLFSENIYSIVLLIVLASLTRLLPHPFNFTAVGAIALFSGAVLKDKRFAFFIPLTVLFFTDIILGFHFSMLPVYASFALTVGVGIFIKHKQSIFSIAFASLFSSLLFFLITNLPVWYIDQGLYPITFSGTIESYTMAIPFFKNQVIGDLFYNALLFGTFYLFAEKKQLIKIKS